ncbi:MAG: carbonic anhydrase family protein [Lactobacillaceae bacterium]|jgi:carbonic anhydrase|nr:carbonic anhydrase family protein [Lactobacillaceae bacterium]
MQYIDYNKQNEWKTVTTWQSPVALNLETAIVVEEPKLDLKINLADQQNVERVDWEIGPQFLATGTLNFKGQDYALVRFHFHDGSEHLLNGQRLAAELHFVFQNSTDLLVLGVLIQEDAAKDDLVAQLFSGITHDVDLKELLPVPVGRSYFEYIGTLTTPPLKQAIQTVILQESITLSKADLLAIHNAFPDNHRQIQPLNGRTVHLHQA